MLPGGVPARRLAPGSVAGGLLVRLGRSGRSLPRALRLAAQGACRRRGAKPAHAHRRNRRRRLRARRRVRRAGRRDSHGRHAVIRARALHEIAHRHPDHDAGIAIPDAGVAGASCARERHHRDRRRDSRAGADQARRAPGAVAGTARDADGPYAAAHRTVRHRSARGRSGAVPRRRHAACCRSGDGVTVWPGPAGGPTCRARVADSRGVRGRRHVDCLAARHHRGRTRAEAARAARGSARGRHGAARQAGRDRERGAARASRAGAVDLGQRHRACWN